MTKLDTTFKSAEESPGFVLWKAANLLQRLHADCLQDLDITPTQFSLMTCLVYLHQSGPVTAARIVTHTGMDKMMVSDLLKTLTRKRLVARSDHPDDARSYIISPTAVGRNKTNAGIRKIETLDTDFFKRAGDVRTLHKALLALIAPE